MTISLKITKAVFLLTTGLLGAFNPLSAEQIQSKPKAAVPNVIFILADDLGYGDISTYGATEISTPNIDQIANDGVLFTQAYAPAAVCSPSRAGIITGRYPHRFGFEFNAGGSERTETEGLGLDTNEITLAQMLKEQGYATGLVGKWHLGSQDGIYRPNDRGFDYFFGLHNGETLYIDPTLPNVVSEPGIATTRDDLAKIYENDVVVSNLDTYLTEDLTAKAIGFIEQHQDNPFFLYLTYSAPHKPLQATTKYLDRFPNEPTQKRQIFKAMISAMDDGVGDVLATLNNLNLTENTIVIFSSDNGCALGDTCNPGIVNGTRLYGGKFSFYEGGVRIPFMIRWPDRIQQGRVFESTVSLLDVVPTLVSAAQGTLPADREYDGVDLLPFIDGTKENVPHAYLFWKADHLSATRLGDWKLYEGGTPDPDNYLQNPPFNPPTFSLLYNVKTDPGERTNLSNFMPRMVGRLQTFHDMFKTEISPPSWPARRLVPRPIIVDGAALYVPL